MTHQITATILFESSFWVGIFERTDSKGYAVVRKVFGSEPSDAEIYDFVLHNYHELKFGAPKEFQLTVKRMNPKRLQREVRREMERVRESTRPSTHAQDYMREELEKKKKEKKSFNSHQKEERLDEKFRQKQEKRKEKHRGH